MQADTYARLDDLHHTGRQPGPITEATCWAHERCKLFSLAEVGTAPTATAAVRQIDAIFNAERNLIGLPTAGLSHRWWPGPNPGCGQNEGTLSRRSEVARVINYMLQRWLSLSRFVHDGRFCMTNNVAERVLRGIAAGPKARLFAASDRGGKRAVGIHTLIVTAKLNGLDLRV